MTKWIGITGTIGSGKSTVADYLRERQFEVIDADQISKRVTAKGTPGELAVMEHFGEGVVTCGELDRVKLANLVFKEESKLRELEAIVHPRIGKIVDQLKAEVSAPVAFYDVPLLFEMKLESKFYGILVVSAPPEIAEKRTRQRTWGMTSEGFQARLRSQIPAEVKIAKANWHISNEGTLEELKAKVDQFIATNAHRARLPGVI